VGEFNIHRFENNSYDIILFNSSLHHFKDVKNILQTKVLPLLKNKGYLLIFEYVGPNRLQWTKHQLEFANKLLTELPAEYRIRFGSKSIKGHIYRPGLLRMLFVDPSEAIDSESILPSIHKCFKTIEEKKIGWDITHLLFKDIAHNFLNNDAETQELLSYILKKEDEYLSITGRSDAAFGIYQK
jgi:SAM-dependent methyltransferase